MENIEIIKKYETFFSGNINQYFSPGRVNLIGEHIDYHGGNVFPLAINLGTYGFVSKRNDNLFRMYSLSFSEQGIIERSIQDLEFKAEDDWSNYLKGIIKEIIALGYKIDSGLDILISSNLPNGAGLSSSASIELLMGVILNEEYNLGIDKIDLVKIAQRVENDYIGVNCGIMDQFAVMMGKKDKAILLNTNNLDYSYVDLNFDGYSLVIVNTLKRRSLSSSKYNERKEECNIGLNILKENNYQINNLCELKNRDLIKIRELIKNETIYKRIKHVITENERTMKAFEMLKNNDLIEFGKLMNESHESLREDYEVSCEELDIIQEAFIKNGALGSRMTGAGFGGCTINLVENKNLNAVLKAVEKEYFDKTKIMAEFYIVKTSQGTSLIRK